MAGLYARVVAHPWIAPIKPAWQRARRTSAPLRFFVGEMRGGGRIGRYTLRGAAAAPFSVRHGTPDAEVLHEVVLDNTLQPPAPVAAQLDALGRPPVILDLGANVGLSAAWFAARWPGARVICVEPDPANLEVLADAAGRSGGAWTVIGAAAAAREGSLQLATTGFALSHVADAGDTRVPAIDAFALIERERPDLLKVDVEGSEWDLLDDARVASLAVPAVVMEVHPRDEAEPDPVAVAEERLREAGYATDGAGSVRG
jgi:FkbM family methyltransferase